MFERYNTSTVPHIELSLSSDASKTSKGQGGKSSQANDKTSLKLRGKPSFAAQERKAFLGRMGTNEDFPHSIPNAWMASTPSHPFWLLPLESIKDNVYSGKEPEYLTGPTALYERVKQYKEEYDGGEGNKMDEHYAKGPWRHLFKTSAQKQLMAPPQSMVILPFWEVYPYSWDRDGSMCRHVCWVLDDKFDAKKCKSFLGLDARKSHSITYWSHSWSGSENGDGYWYENMKHISGSDDNTIETKGKEAGNKEEDKGDANEWKKWKKTQEERKKKQEARQKEQD